MVVTEVILLTVLKLVRTNSAKLQLRRCPVVIVEGVKGDLCRQWSL